MSVSKKMFVVIYKSANGDTRWECFKSVTDAEAFVSNSVCGRAIVFEGQQVW